MVSTRSRKKDPGNGSTQSTCSKKNAGGNSSAMKQTKAAATKKKSTSSTSRKNVASVTNGTSPTSEPVNMDAGTSARCLDVGNPQGSQIEGQPTMPGPLQTITNTQAASATSPGSDQDPSVATIELLKKQLAAEQEARLAAEARGSKYKKLAQKEREAKKQAKNDAEAVVPDIPRPQGKDKRTKIQQALGLTDDDDTYHKIQNRVKMWFIQSGTDLSLSWKNQPIQVKTKVVQLARDEFPLLARCEGDWATLALLQQYVKNHLGYQQSKANPNSSYNRKRIARGLSTSGSQQTPGNDGNQSESSSDQSDHDDSDDE
ncbi:hypothetical protein FRC03_001911 [Tulasnella sp. 419]|nr:hypothetical protein FRC03_001911 [Tulasnella sp. 419]